MKKLFVLLLALTVVGVAFAQDAAPALKWSGYINSGIQIQQGDNGATVDSVVLNGFDAMANSRINLNGSYTNGDFGAAFRMRAQNFDTGGVTTANIWMRRVYGWQNFAGGMVKVQAGKLADYTWAASGGQWNGFGNFDGPTGVQVQVKPMDGLNLGIFLPASSTALKLADAFQSSTIGLAYTMKDVVAIQAGYQMAPDTVAVAGGAAATKGNSSIYVGGNVYAVPGLTAWFEAQMAKFGSDSKLATNYVLLSGHYTMDALTVGAWANVMTFASNDKMQFSAYPNVAYVMGDLKAMFGFWYGSTSAGDLTGMSIEPSVLYTVNKSSTVRLGLYYNMGKLVAKDARWAEGSGAFATSAKDVGIATVVVDFVYNF